MKEPGMRLPATTFLVLAAALLLALPARAAETPEQEIGGLFQCAAALGLYDSIGESPGSGATDVDKALAASVSAFEPQLKGRVDALAPVVGEDGMKTQMEAAKADVTRRLAPLKDDPEAPRKMLDLYRPVLEDCLVRARALPAA